MGIDCHLKIQTRDCQHGNTGPEEFPASEEKDQYKGVREEWIKHNYLICFQCFAIYGK